MPSETPSPSPQQNISLARSRSLHSAAFWNSSVLFSSTKFVRHPTSLPTKFVRRPMRSSTKSIRCLERVVFICLHVPSCCPCRMNYGGVMRTFLAFIRLRILRFWVFVATSFNFKNLIIKCYLDLDNHNKIMWFILFYFIFL